MTPHTPTHCPDCGAELDAASCCPRCLMRAAMQPTEPASAGREVPSLAAVGAAFPQLEILALIGQGGMGCVFKARQPKLNRLVALKLLPASLAERDAAFAGRFEREGQLLARLHHPNIVAVHDSGYVAAPSVSQLSTPNSQPGFYYLLMEFVEGVNLRQAMRSARFTPAQALAIVPHICDALQFAHDEGVLHRDIKPENILLDGKGRVKLADFGIAKLVGEGTERTKGTQTTPSLESLESLKSLSSLTQSGTTLGTPSYMAPEQRDTPADVDHRADIYSLGVVFYELLTGELPTGSVVQPSAKSTADPRVDAIVQQALERERTRRQHSASEVKTQVESVKNAPATSEPGYFTSLPVPTRKRLLAILILLALVGTILFCGFRRTITGNSGTLQQPTTWQSSLSYGLIGSPWCVETKIYHPNGGQNSDVKMHFLTSSFAIGVLTAAAWVLLLIAAAAEGKARLPYEQRVALWTVFSKDEPHQVRWKRMIAAVFVTYAIVTVAMSFTGAAMFLLLGDAPPILMLSTMGGAMMLGPVFGVFGRASGVKPEPLDLSQKKRLIILFAALAVVFVFLLALFVLHSSLESRGNNEPPLASQYAGWFALFPLVVFALTTWIWKTRCHRQGIAISERQKHWLLLAAPLALLGGILLFFLAQKRQTHPLEPALAPMEVPAQIVASPQPFLESAQGETTASVPPKNDFAPAIERSLYFSDNLRVYLDFQSGDLSRAGWAFFEPPTDETQQKWLKQTGVDAFAVEPIVNNGAQPGGTTREHPRLTSWSSGCVFAMAPHSRSFDDPRAEEMEARLKDATERHALMGGTYWFKTSDGAKGILHLYGINDSPPQVQLRYRLFQQPGVPKRER